LYPTGFGLYFGAGEALVFSASGEVWLVRACIASA
jgi:hypothetical protein